MVFYTETCTSFLMPILMYEGGTQKFPELLKKKKLFKIFIQVWHFSHLHSSSPVTGRSDPSAAVTAGNAV